MGSVIDLTIGPVAHGGHWVARTDEGQVVFVRHALEGERVRARITDDSARFLRADAVEIVEPSPARVAAPCPLAHADGCGGCDFQHVALDEQRALKAAVVAEQLQRLAGIAWPVVCEPVPGDHDGLRWRTRMQWVDLGDGRRGLRKHRSHEAVEVEDCLIAHPQARSGPGLVVENVRHRSFSVAADGFWQVHPGAPGALVDTVLAMLDPRPGESALDLYSGVGLFTAFLAEAVGERGRVIGVEGSREATALARENLADLPWTRSYAGRVDRWLHHNRGRSDLVVLDPPRAGAKRAVVSAVAARQPRAVAYVACDPAALARDVAYFAEEGYELRDLRCLDLFPMTHHVECVALINRVCSE
ncbi:MAG TPA: TRAM domain-containing protein [Marmoricola sp.]